jgi:DNA-binding GntR family transcriptional regulator
MLTTLPTLGVRENLAEVIYRVLREAITDGSLAPGERLREIPLARQFEVSTTPIREALRRLEREGLVEISPRRGAVVQGYDLREIEHLYEAREVVECRAVRRAAEAPTRDFSRVDALLAEAATVLDDPVQIQFMRLDVELHRALNDIGGNKQIADLAERVHRQIQRVRVRCAVHLQDRPRVSHAEHEALVAAVRARQADRAEELSRAHIRGVRDAVMQALEASPQRTAL